MDVVGVQQQWVRTVAGVSSRRVAAGVRTTTVLQFAFVNICPTHECTQKKLRVRCGAQKSLGCTRHRAGLSKKPQRPGRQREIGGGAADGELTDAGVSVNVQLPAAPARAAERSCGVGANVLAASVQCRALVHIWWDSRFRESQSDLLAMKNTQ